MKGNHQILITQSKVPQLTNSSPAAEATNEALQLGRKFLNICKPWAKGCKDKENIAFS